MVDKTLILKRLKELKNFSKDVEFAQFLGISSANISAWFKRNTFDYNIIVDKFPEVNKNWLLTGEGEMLKSETFKPKETEIPENSTYNTLLQSNEKIANAVIEIARSNTILAESNAKLLDTNIKLFESNQKLVDQLATLVESQKRDVADVRGAATKVAHG